MEMRRLCHSTVLFFSKQRLMREKNEAHDALQDRKERRDNSINRNFFGDYVGVEFKTALHKLIPKKKVRRRRNR